MAKQKRSRNRLFLVVAIVATKVVCLMGGIFVAGQWIGSDVVEVETAQAFEDNRMIAAQFGKLIDVMGLAETTPDSDDWKKLQAAVEEIKLPNDGFVCVTHGSTGQLICHPQILDKPELKSMTPGLKNMVNPSGHRSIVEQVSQAAEGESASGAVTLSDGIHIVAARRLSNLNANVMAHQRMDAIEAASRAHLRPLYLIGLPMACLIVAISSVASWFWMKQFDEGMERVNSSLEERLDERNSSLTKTRNAIIFGLAKLAENRDTDTGEHLDRIREYSTLLARKLKEKGFAINDAFVADIGLATALHDIGKVGIPDAVLLKPGKLNKEERAIIETHPAIGCKCLLSIEKHLGDDRFLEMATEICLTHHEKWDGTGYPLGLSGARIPLSARIVAVADVYDALTSKRPYKEAMDHEDAHSIIMEGSGSHFDPDVVVVFDELFYQFKSVRMTYHDIDTGPTLFDVVDAVRPNLSTNDLLSTLP